MSDWTDAKEARQTSWNVPCSLLKLSLIAAGCSYPSSSRQGRLTQDGAHGWAIRNPSDVMKAGGFLRGHCSVCTEPCEGEIGTCLYLWSSLPG